MDGLRYGGVLQRAWRWSALRGAGSRTTASTTSSASPTR